MCCPPHSSRCQTPVVLGSLAKGHSRSLDLTGDPRGVLHPIPTKAPSIGRSSRFSNILQRLSEVLRPSRRSRSTAKETSHRVSADPMLSGVLQPSLFSFKGVGRLEAGSRRERIERFRKENEIFDGNDRVSVSISSTGRLDGLDRPPGCVLPRSYPSGIKEVPEVCFPKQSFPVQSSLFRTVNCTSSVYKSSVNGGEESSLPRNKDVNVSGRLASESTLQSQMCGGPNEDIISGKGTRPTSQCSEIVPVTITADSLFGSENGLSDFSGFSINTESRVLSKHDRRLSTSRGLLSQPVDELTGDLSLDGEVRKTGETQDEASAVLSTKPMATQNPSGFLSFQDLRSDQEGAVLVEFKGKATGGNFSFYQEPRPHTLVRRFGSGVGSDFRQQGMFGPVAGRAERTAHKCERAESGTSSPDTISARSKRQGYSSSVGQHDSSCLYQEARGHSFLLPVSDDQGTFRMVGRERGHVIDQVHKRREECNSGSFKQEEPSLAHGMDLTSAGLQTIVESVGLSASRPICNRQNKTPPSILLPRSGRQGTLGGCNDNELGLPRSLRFSTVQNYQEGLGKVQEPQEHQDDSNRSLLAIEGMVPRSSPPPRRFSEDPPVEERSTQTTPLPEVPPELVRSTACRLQTVERLLRKRGFSKEVASAIARPRRKSSDAVYQARWNQFRTWCNRHGVSSSKTSLNQIAKFLLSLFKEKGLSLSTIKGYRSMLASVFKHRGLDISNNQDLTDLLKSFNTSKTKVPKQIAWNLDIVLKWICSDQFEPLANASLRNLTKKTIFLVTLATARRVSEVHALDKTIGFSQGKAVCSSSLRFLAKNEDASRPWPRSFSIKSLSDLVGEGEQERLLCLVRALKFYIHRTKGIRGSSENLWCSVRNPSRPLSKNALAFFLREVISEAHVNCQDSDTGTLKVRAHEIRAVATSLAFRHNLSVQKIVNSTFWRCKSVFASHYLSELKTDFDNGSTLGPLVVTDTVVGEGERGATLSD